MTTDNDTPVAPGVLGDSFAFHPATVGGTLVGPGAGTRTITEEEEFVDNYDLTLGDNDDYSLSEKMVHYCGGHILQVHWNACKAVLAFYAGSRVSKLTTSKKPAEMERECCLEIYYNAIKSLTWIISIRMLVNFFVTLSRRRRNPCLHTLFGGITTTLLGPNSQECSAVLSKRLS